MLVYSCRRNRIGEFILCRRPVPSAVHTRSLDGRAGMGPLEVTQPGADGGPSPPPDGYHRTSVVRSTAPGRHKSCYDIWLGCGPSNRATLVAIPTDDITQRRQRLYIGTADDEILRLSRVGAAVNATRRPSPNDRSVKQSDPRAESPSSVTVPIVVSSLTNTAVPRPVSGCTPADRGYRKAPSVECARSWHGRLRHRRTQPTRRLRSRDVLH